MSLATMWAGIQAAAAGGGTPQAQNVIISVFDTSASNTVAAFNVQRDGDINEFNPSQQDVGDYVSTGATATIGDQFEVRVIQTSGDVLDDNPGLNVWLQINGNRRWGFNKTPGEFNDFGGNWEVREIADTGNTSGVKSVSLVTEDGS